MKKTFVFLASFVMLCSSLSFLTPVYVNAQAQDEVVSDQVQDEREFIEVVSGNIKRTTDAQGEIKIEILDAENLDAELKAINAPISASELQNVINKFNSYIAEDNAVFNQTKNDVLQELPNPRLRISCGDVMGAIGLIHSGAYSAAAYLLGVTGPAAVVIPLLVSTAYYLGSLLC